jgi:hypothetical protein
MIINTLTNQFETWQWKINEHRTTKKKKTNTRNFLGNAPGKTHKGKTSQGDFLLIELIGKNLSYNSKNISTLNTHYLSRKMCQ